jgi:3',5'-cyclic AMP phosphodiesterase CpdA
MTRITHISDIHFGRIAHPGIVDALVADINAAGVDLVVVSGDLTQRAFGHQFRAARRMLDAFDAPTLVVPGNHDVFPWWRVFSRLFDPLRRFKRLITDDLAPHWTNGDVAVQGVNSAFGWTIQGGRITEKELDQIRHGFDRAPGEALKILVVHHHLAELIELGEHDIARGAEKAFATAQEAGVQLILCGHLHIAHIAPVGKHPGDGIVVATAGTSTSNRGRGSNKAVNHFNLITVEDADIRIQERVYRSSEDRFEGVATHQFQR